MKNAAWLVAFVLLGSPSLSYFKYERPIQLTGVGQQYVIVDETIWKHSRSDLGDLRLYAGEAETPYSLIIEHGSQERERTDVPVLQPSTVAGKTQFLIDMSRLAEYDHVDLKLSTKTFVAHAHVEGQDDPHGQHWASLGDSILYDLSKENLGGNHILRLPRSTYKYLRVTIDGACERVAQTTGSALGADRDIDPRGRPRHGGDTARSTESEVRNLGCWSRLQVSRSRQS